jgi:hypothetical protein
MSALPQTYWTGNRESVGGTAANSTEPSRLEAINRQIEAEQHTPKLGLEVRHIAEEDNAFFAIPEFRLKPAHAEQVFAATKEWEGTIESVGNSHFLAQLREIRPKADEGTDIAEIPIGDVPRSDRDLLREGAVFRYLVGYAKSAKGVTRKRHVYLRRGTTKATDKASRWLEIAAKFRHE